MRTLLPSLPGKLTKKTGRELSQLIVSVKRQDPPLETCTKSTLYHFVGFFLKKEKPVLSCAGLCAKRKEQAL